MLAWAIAGMPAAWIAGMPIVGAVADARVARDLARRARVAGLAALALVRLRPRTRQPAHRRRASAAWRRPDVARFTAGELLANAAWAGVLTYSGTPARELLVSSAVVALGLGLTAAAMLPGTFAARRRAAPPRRAARRADGASRAPPCSPWACCAPASA